MVSITLVYNLKGTDLTLLLLETPTQVKHLKQLCTQKLGEDVTLDCNYILFSKNSKIDLDRDDLFLTEYYKQAKIEIHLVKNLDRVTKSLDQKWGIIQASDLLAEKPKKDILSQKDDLETPDLKNPGKNQQKSIQKNSNQDTKPYGFSTDDRIQKEIWGILDDDSQDSNPDDDNLLKLQESKGKLIMEKAK
jgi:hypothetical protein